MIKTLTCWYKSFSYWVQVDGGGRRSWFFESGCGFFLTGGGWSSPSPGSRVSPPRFSAPTLPPTPTPGAVLCCCSRMEAEEVEVAPRPRTPPPPVPAPRPPLTPRPPPPLSPLPTPRTDPPAAPPTPRPRAVKYFIFQYNLFLETTTFPLCCCWLVLLLWGGKNGGWVDWK